MPHLHRNNEFLVGNVLRQATHSNHLRLNRHTMLFDLTQPELSLTKYRNLLRAYRHFYAGVECNINKYLIKYPGTFQYAERYKLPWLVDDLVFFHDAEEAPDLIISRALYLPEIQQVGQLIGVLYTLEGATLGGQVISRSLAEHHGLTSSKGARFFNGYGVNTTNMWQVFLRFAESISDNEVECNAAIISACNTFRAFEQVINSIEHQENMANVV